MKRRRPDLGIGKEGKEGKGIACRTPALVFALSLSLFKYLFCVLYKLAISRHYLHLPSPRFHIVLPAGFAETDPRLAIPANHIIRTVNKTAVMPTLPHVRTFQAAISRAPSNPRSHSVAPICCAKENVSLWSFGVSSERE